MEKINDASKDAIHNKRLLLFGERLKQFMTEQQMDTTKFFNRINEMSNDATYDRATIKTYTERIPPSEPNIHNAIDIARVMGVDLYYLFGLDHGEFIYTANVKSLLINLFRTFQVEGIRVGLRRSHKETGIWFDTPIWEKTMQEVIDIPKRKTSFGEKRYNIIKEKELIENFKNNLKIAMNELGISNKELAQYIQLDNKTIDNYRYGRNDRKNSKIAINDIIDVACALDISLEYLVGIEQERMPFRILDTPESKVINLYKALQNAKFKMRDEGDRQKVAYIQNETIYLFFKQIESLGIKSIKDAYHIAKKIDSDNLWVVNGEIQQYDPSIETNLLGYLQFITENSLYTPDINHSSVINQKKMNDIVNKLWKLKE